MASPGKGRARGSPRSTLLLLSSGGGAGGGPPLLTEPSPGLIIVNAWYGKFVNDKSKKNEKVKVIDVTVPLQCLVKDSKLILTEASKVQRPVPTGVDGPGFWGQRLGTAGSSQRSPPHRQCAPCGPLPSTSVVSALDQFAPRAAHSFTPQDLSSTCCAPGAAANTRTR